MKLDFAKYLDFGEKQVILKTIHEGSPLWGAFSF